MFIQDNLQKEKDLKVAKKDKLLERKCEIKDEIDQLQEDRLSYKRKGYSLSVSNTDLKIKKLKSQLPELNKQLNDLKDEIKSLSKQCEFEEFKKINADYIANNMLSDEDIKNLIVELNRIPKKLESLNDKYDSFIKNIDSYSNNVTNDLWFYDLSQLKDKINSIIDVLSDYKNQYDKYKQFKDLKQLNDLISVINDSEKDLEDMKTKFEDCKNLASRSESIVDDYKKFLQTINVNLNKSHEKFCDDELKLIQAKINYYYLFLLKNQKYCFDYKKSGELLDILDNYTEELDKTKDILDSTINLSKKFNSTIIEYNVFLADFDLKINELKNEYYDCDDLENLQKEVNTRMEELSNRFNRYFDFDNIDQLFNELDPEYNYLNKMDDKFNECSNISKEFDSIINDYSKFISQLESYWSEEDILNLNEHIREFVKKAETESDNLLDYQLKSFIFEDKEELDNMLFESKKNLEKLNEDFNKSKKDLYDKSLQDMKLLLDKKLDVYSNLNSKTTSIRDNTIEFNDMTNENDLLNNLNEIDSKLDQYYNDLSKIKDYLDETTMINTIQVKDIDYMDSIRKNLNQITFEDLEKSVSEMEDKYEAVSNQNNKLTNDSEKLLNEFVKYLKKPILRQQLKKYNLKDDEFSSIKNKIRDDIINQQIEDKPDFKNLIETSFEEFINTQRDFDENQLDDLIDIGNFKDVDEKILSECKNLIKKDLTTGNIKSNNAKLKFRMYVNNKINEDNQLKDLDKIRNSSNVPKNKIYLSQEEREEIYESVKNQIISENSIKGTVEDRVEFLNNQKIKSNQSKARGKLTIMRRDFNKLLKLDIQQQDKFVSEIELMIDENKIKHEDITEENIIKLSHEFLNKKL